MINSSERSDILVFNYYLCHVSFLLTCYVCSTKIGEISDISKCFEDFVSQALGFLTRNCAAELRYYINLKVQIVFNIYDEKEVGFFTYDSDTGKTKYAVRADGNPIFFYFFG